MKKKRAKRKSVYNKEKDEEGDEEIKRYIFLSSKVFHYMPEFP